MSNERNKFGFSDLMGIYQQPLMELIDQARAVHRLYHHPYEVQICSLISIKTGGCPEDCKYCSQSSRYTTPTSAEAMLSYQDVLIKARKAIDQGATRICLGAAWRQVRDSKQFEEVLQLIKGISELGVEVCCALGMLSERQAERLKKAGLYAYNHNLDCSKRFYPTIISTRTYEDRLTTLELVGRADISVCCGAILGMGETVEDRLEFLLALTQLDKEPDSVPLNRLVAIPGTPLAERPLLSIWELLRMIAVTRLALPRAMVRLSAGRMGMSDEEHALCFLAGANSIHSGEKLLTVSNPSLGADLSLLHLLGLRQRPRSSP